MTAPKKPLAIYVYAHEAAGQFVDTDAAGVAEYAKDLARDFDGNNDPDGFHWIIVKTVDQADISVEVTGAGTEDVGGTQTTASKGLFGPTAYTTPLRGFFIRGLIHAGDYTGPVRSQRGVGAYRGAHLRDFRHGVEDWIHANAAQLSKVIAARTAAPAAR